MITTSKYLQFLASREKFIHERREIIWANFQEMRIKLGNCIRRLKEADEYEAIENSDKIRALLSTCLTSPVPFDSSLCQELNVLGQVAELERRWGLGGELESAKQIASLLTHEINPLREELNGIIRIHLAEGKNIKIICHKKAKAHFLSLLPQEASDSALNLGFIHTLNDYAASELFDILIKVGPLRSWGWGAIPDSVKSSPKYHHLIQILWSGSGDDTEYGYDPAKKILKEETLCNNNDLKLQETYIKWEVVNVSPNISTISNNQYLLESEEDLLLSEVEYASQRRSVILIQLPDDVGILCSPEGVLSYDPNSKESESVAIRIPFETLQIGMYYINAQIDSQNPVQVMGDEGGYSRVWKERLRNELRISPNAICLILENKGIRLQNLRARVESWSLAPTAVIHAPMRRIHFKILIEALAIDSKILNESIPSSRPWWERAWDEVRASRGEAIQTGRKESLFIQEQTTETLKAMAKEIREKTVNVDNAIIRSLQGIQGIFRLFKIIDIEDGFTAPSNEIEIVANLASLEKWKIN